MRRSDQRRDAVFASYQRDVTGRPLAELVADVQTADPRAGRRRRRRPRRTRRDDRRTPAQGWTVDRIAPLDLNVMRVALFEIEEGETPLEVAIDEAVEIAKEYCGADAPELHQRRARRDRARARADRVSRLREIAERLRPDRRRARRRGRARARGAPPRWPPRRASSRPRRSRRPTAAPARRPPPE